MKGRPWASTQQSVGGGVSAVKTTWSQAQIWFDSKAAVGLLALADLIELQFFLNDLFLKFCSAASILEQQVFDTGWHSETPWTPTEVILPMNNKKRIKLSFVADKLSFVADWLKNTILPI